VLVVFLSHSLLEVSGVMLSLCNADEKGDRAFLSFVIKASRVCPACVTVLGISDILISLAAGGNTFLASNEVQCQLKVMPHRKTLDKIAIF